MPIGEKQTFRFGPFQLDTQCGQLRKNGIGLKLQGQPVQILEILLEKPGQLVTREEIRQRLWASGTFVDFDHSLNTAVKKLRQALGDEADTPRYVETLPKRGYRFIGEVAVEKPQRENLPARLPVADNSVARTIEAILTDARVSPSTTSAKRSLRGSWLAALSLAVLLTVAATIYWVSRPSPLPRIVGSHALTKTGTRKGPFASRLLTDGGTIYYEENRLSGAGEVIRLRVACRRPMCS